MVRARFLRVTRLVCVCEVDIVVVCVTCVCACYLLLWSHVSNALVSFELKATEILGRPLARQLTPPPPPPPLIQLLTASSACSVLTVVFAIIYMCH